MDFRELTYILAIAKRQNIMKAAESLYVGQPTLSKFLIALEQDLGLKLFRRMGPLRAVRMKTTAACWTDRWVDVAFYSKPSTVNRMIEYATLWEEEMLLCTCKGHPLGRFARSNPASQYPKLDPALLKNELVLLMLPERRTRQIMDEYLSGRSLKFENVMYTSNMPAIMELVSVDYGVSFIFESHLRRCGRDLPIERFSFGEPRMASDFVAAYRKGSYLSRYAQDFIEIARRALSASEDAVSI